MMRGCRGRGTGFDVASGVRKNIRAVADELYSRWSHGGLKQGKGDLVLESCPEAFADEGTSQDWSHLQRNELTHSTLELT